MVAFSTDMSVPKDVARIQIKIATETQREFKFDYEIAPDGQFHLPGTLAIVAGKKDGERVQVSVVGIRWAGEEIEARTLAKAVTTIPRSRIARLPLSIQWLCDESVVAVGEEEFASTCEPDEGVERACRAGDCVPVEINEADLDTYVAPSTVPTEPGAPADADVCFDTVPCLEAGEDVVPESDCSFRARDDGRELNVGLRLLPGGDGICDEAQPLASCYVPLDRSDDFGWREELDEERPGERTIFLPPAVCRKLDVGAFAAVRVSGVCATKTQERATCGPWASAQTPTPVVATGPIAFGEGGQPGVGQAGAGGSGGSEPVGVGGSTAGGGSGGTDAGGTDGTDAGGSGGTDAGGSGSGGADAGGAGAGGADSGGAGAGGAGAGGDGGTLPPSDCVSGPLTFADPNLEADVRSAIGVAFRDILPSYVTGLTDLQLGSSAITTLAGVECLGALSTLDFSNNQITDLTPLVDNAGLDSGDIVSGKGNPLDCAAQAANIDALLARGVNLVTDCNGPTDCVNGPLRFVDQNLEAAVREAVAKPDGNLMPPDVAALTSLAANDRGIASLVGIECLTALTQLELDGNVITDLNPLTGLDSLTTLGLSGNDITDLSPLTSGAFLAAGDSVDVTNNPFDCFTQSGALQQLEARPVSVLDDCGYVPTDCVNGPLTFVDPDLEARVRSAALISAGPLLPQDVASVTQLSASYASITSLEGIECLTGLTTLYLSGNAISDISRLSGLTALTMLQLDSTSGITDLTPLSGLTNLDYLSAHNNQVANLTPLASLTLLRTLGLGGNSIIDITPLVGLTNLQDLRLSSNDIVDISSLAGLTQLSSLELSNNAITSVSALSALTLGRLEVNGNPIADISPLAGMTSLGSLNIANTGSSDLSYLTNLTGLWNLTAGSNGVTDVTPLQGLTNLSNLDLYDNDISNAAPLSALTNLNYLDVSFNTVGDLSFVAPLQWLYGLYVSYNSFTDLAPLANNSGLADGDYVDIAGNPLDCTAQAPHIATLVDRDVVVASDCAYSVSNCVDGPLTFMDPNLEQVVRAAVGIPFGDILPLDVVGVTSLDSEGSPPIRDLWGLECLTNLTELYLDANDIENLRPIRRLVSLTDLSLGSNAITDVSPLSSLAKLSWLYLANNDISDIAPLGQLSNKRLKSLYLSQNAVTDLTALSNLKGLVILDLRANAVSNLLPIGALTKLSTLDLQSNVVTDLTSIVANTGIGAGDYVNLDNNPLDCGVEANNVATLLGRNVSLFSPCN